MERITFKSFIDTLCNNCSVLVACPFPQDNTLVAGKFADLDFTPDEDFGASLAAAALTTTQPVRRVKLRQTNAIMFDNDSWLYFKPYLNEKRESEHRAKVTAYRHSVDGKNFLIMKTYNPERPKTFGGTLEANTMILAYLIA